MTIDDLSEVAHAALNKLCKWRSVFAGWQLGTRADTDPECRAVKDHRELTILLRAEVSALSSLLIEKGVLTQEDLTRALTREAEQLDKDYEKLFPGISTSEMGVHFEMPLAAQTMKGWPP